MAIALPRHTPTEADNIRLIALFFNIGETSAMMQQLTGVNASSLSRIVRGQTSRSAEWEHVAVVAAFVRELREVIIASTGQREASGDMSAWLVTAQLPTRNGMVFARDALADEGMARDALAALREVAA